MGLHAVSPHIYSEHDYMCGIAFYIDRISSERIGFVFNTFLYCRQMALLYT